MVKQRNKRWYIFFRPFRDRQIGLKVDAETKSQAEQIEAVIVHACRTGNYRGLDPASREACIRMFVNQQWELPADLGGMQPCTVPDPKLTLWRAAELFFKDPEIKRKSEKALVRYRLCVVNLVGILGKDTPLKRIWVPQLKVYQAKRLDEAAAPNTVNIEISCLSRIFAIAMEMQLVDANPARLVKRLSTKSNQREVYLSRQTVQDVAGKAPHWYQRIIWCAFYTGMRRGEILSLNRKQVNLAKRMIYLRPEDTKEGQPKRVPIHRELVPILDEALHVPTLRTDKVFLIQDHRGIREPGTDSFDNPWPRACRALGMEKPYPRFHDLRHTWRTNARRSGMDFQIAESIMGHWFKGKSVNDRYGRISDAELLAGCDLLTFDHGETEIVIPGFVGKKCEQNVNKERVAR